MESSIKINKLEIENVKRIKGGKSRAYIQRADNHRRGIF